MDFERQLRTMADKAKLREWVDALPDGTKGVVIACIPAESGCEYPQMIGFGDITYAETVYQMLFMLHHHIFAKGE